MFWFFKKKESDINNLNSKLHTSFSNLKQDINVIHAWIEHFKEEHNTHKKHHKIHYDNHNKVYNEIRILKEEIREIKQFLYANKISQKREELITKEPTKEIQEASNLTFLSDLMPSQENIIRATIGLINESGAEWIPMKAIAKEVYPNTKYENIKSMISNHTDFFLNFGLLEKKRKGRQTYISLTNKGREAFKKTLKKESKIITSPKQKNMI